MKIFRMLPIILILTALMGVQLPAASAQMALRCYVKADAIGANTGDSWENAYTDLQSALGASPCTEIWVAAGTYYPGVAQADTFTLKSGVAIYGGFNGTEEQFGERDVSANIAILSGGIGGSSYTDNSYHVVSGGGVDNTAILDGFSIQSGYTGNNSCGGGMLNISSNPTLTNLSFNGNRGYYGAGLCNISSTPSLTNVSFNGNKVIGPGGGGGIYNENSSLILKNVTFAGNNCECTTTEPGYLCPGNDGGGMFNTNSDPLLINVTFHENWGDDGGAIYNSNSSPILLNVTFWGNWNQGSGGASDSSAMLNSNSNVVIRNGIIGEDKIKNSLSTLLISDSLLEGGCPVDATCIGTIINANAKLEPLANNGGFTQTMGLEPASPAIDAGNNATCAETDQRGVARPQGSACDMGAYEVDYPPEVKSIFLADPNPTSKNRIRFDVTFSEFVQNLDVSDFALTTSGTMGASSITDVSGSGADYTVSVETALGNGAIRLDVKEATDIQDLTGNHLIGSFTLGEVYTVKKLLTFRTQPAYDGYIWESTETSGIGLRGDSTDTTFSIGDDNVDRQYLAILSFNTGPLPDDAVITRIALRIKQSTTVGVSPFTTHGGLKVDIRKPYFGTTITLTASDFQAAASKPAVGMFGVTPVNDWYTAVLTSASYPYLNLAGTTQFRLRFQLDDNDDMSADYTRFFSGNYTVASYRPTIVIDYYIP